MPYVENESFKTPPMETKIWRYMDFVKFVNLIGSKKLFLCRADLLGDPEEGRMPEAFHKALENPNSVYINPELKDLFDTPEAKKEFIKSSFGAIFDLIKKEMYISCWHMNEHESKAMWDGFVPGGTGIAIQSTVSNVIDAISGNKETLYIGKVEYTDNENFGPEGPSPFIRYVKKGMQYDHEKEVRILCVGMGDEDKYGGGIRINVDINKLISEIYLPSNTNEWVFETVKNLLSVYELKKPIKIFKK